MSRNKTTDIGNMLPPESRVLLYRTEDDSTRVEVRLQDETVWMLGNHGRGVSNNTTKHHHSSEGHL